MIKHPMCLDTVRQKLDKEEYDDLQDVVADLGQIFNNAKRCKTSFRRYIERQLIYRQHEGFRHLSIGEEATCKSPMIVRY